LNKDKNNSKEDGEKFDNKSISYLYNDYKNSPISDGLTEEQIRDNVSKLHKAVNQSFDASFSVNSNRKNIFNMDTFINGIYGNITSTVMRRKYTSKTINAIMDSPYKFKDELTRMSLYFYIKTQEYKGIIEYKSNMLTYSNVLECSNVVDDSFDMDDYIKNIKFVENYALNSKLAIATKILVRDDVYFAYEVSDNSGKNYIWKKLPTEYCRIIGKDRFETYRVGFDYSYFDLYPAELDKFPVEFASRYNSIRDTRNKAGKSSKSRKKSLNESLAGNNMVFELNGEKAIAFKFDESVDFVLPFFSGMFVDLIRLAELKDVEVVGAVSDNYKLLHQKAIMETESGQIDSFTLSGGYLKQFHENLESTAPPGVGIFTSPMEVQAITLKNGIGTAEDGIVKKQLTNVLTQSGTSQLLFNGSSTSATGLDKNIQVDENMMFKVLRQYEKFMRKRLFLYNKETYKYNLKFLNHTHYNSDVLFERYLKAGQFGFNTEFEVNAVMGRSQLSMINSGRILDKLNIKESMIPFQSSHVGDANTDSGEVGDKKIESKLSEDGRKSRDRNL